MNNEIEKLKKEYLQTPIPQFFEENGFDDVLLRINRKERKKFYLPRYALMAVVVFIVLIGVTGVTFAAIPKSPLYPVKVAAQKAIAKAAHTTPQKVESTIDKFLEIKSSPTPTPTTTVSPTPKPTGEEKKDVDNKKNEQKEDVKGVSVSPTPIENQNSKDSQQHQSLQNH